MSAPLERALPQRAPAIFEALRFRDFRLLWSGLLISNLGTWMQITSIGYLVATLAQTPHRAALYLGILGAARAIPVMLLSPIAGVVADTLPRRRTLLYANLAMSLTALALALGMTFHFMSIGALVVISALNASAQSFDSPARQSWVPLMVPREYVGNAIGLNSVAFNAPAVIGPAVAGVLIVWIGVAGSFYFNAVATLAVVLAVAMMSPSPPGVKLREPMLTSIRNGLRFLVQHRILKWIMLAYTATALLVRPYSQLLPAFVVNVLHAGATHLGIAIGATGVGAFGGALLTAYLGSNRRGLQWLVSGIVMSAGVLALGAMANLWVMLPVLFVIGLATMSFMGATNTLIQTLSPDDVRGRAVSVYTMVALGIVPGGALILGSIASLVGLHLAFAVAGGLCLLVILWIMAGKPIVRTV